MEGLRFHAFPLLLRRSFALSQRLEPNRKVGLCGISQNILSIFFQFYLCIIEISNPIKVISYENGIYEGSLDDNNRFDGRGKFILLKGDGRQIWQGNWENGKMDGTGSWMCIREDSYMKYEGKWKDGRRHGRGKQEVVFFKDGKTTHYEGKVM